VNYFHLQPKNVQENNIKATVLPAVLCGCETQSLILQEEKWLCVFEKRVFKKKLLPKAKYRQASKAC